jgi:hypothetical protein
MLNWIWMIDLVNSFGVDGDVPVERTGNLVLP